MRAPIAIVASALLVGGGVLEVAVAADMESDVKDLQQRVKALEERNQQPPVVPDEGQAHRPQPVEAMGAAKITGGMTVVLQGASSSQLDPQSSAEATMSLDLFFERELGPSGLMLVYLDAAQGQGLTNVPMFTGPNADVEAPDGDAVRLREAWYKHQWRSEMIILTIGKYDPTAFFDASAYANDERSQFLASPFVNNPTIAFGGDPDGYGFGAVLQLRPVSGVEAIVGWEEGDGDFTDFTSRPFTIAELSLQSGWGGREGHYRLYSWTNGTLQTPYDGGPEADNRGFGISFDQQFWEHIGAWVRYGTQNGSIAPFDRFVGGGVDLSGALFGRSSDGIGIGYGSLRISDDYATSSGFESNEGYWEAYYRMGIYGEGENQWVTLTPDVQLVSNAGGDGSLDPIWIWGLRLQAYF